MIPSRFGLQSKIVLITATAIILVVGVSTLTALWLTSGPVEEEVYRRALVMGRLTVPQLVNKDGLQDSETLTSTLTRLQHEMAGLEQIEAMYIQLESALRKIGFLHDENALHMMFHLRRLLGRTGLERSDVGILRGIARQIAWFGGKHEKPCRQ